MSQQEVIPIRVKLTSDDYAGFNRYHGRWQIAFLFLFYWIIFVVIASISGGPKDAGRIGMLIPAGLLLSGLLIGVHLWSIKVKTRKLFESDKLAQLEQEIELTETGIRHTTGATAMNLAWADVYQAAETRNAIFLYAARNKAVVIPKRDIGDLAAVKETLRRHLPAGKLKLKS